MSALHPEIIEFPPQRLVGISLEMSLMQNQTPALWQGFMPLYRRLNISTLRYSLQVYPPGYFDVFNPQTPFTKWALCEWPNDTAIPSDWKSVEFKGGLYAVFKHRGTGTDIFQQIYSVWLPSSGYELADLPHFEIFDAKYVWG
ncbi:MAG: GyrI-like domain-containing protein, partial [Chitinophagaceae bacterium]|nr:GyrI-like domain-containing protein [Chitinophagaceae bacterium]